MPRYKLVIEYAGTRYSGWQIQKNARTVQGEIDRAVRDVTGRSDFELYGSGRTDAGVHALGQVAHLDVSSHLPPTGLLEKVNEALPSDINILSIRTVPHRFHARRDAVARSYLYPLARRRTAFAKAFVWWIKEPLDLAAMRRAAAPLVGMADFRSFTDDDPGQRSTLVAVERLEIAEAGELVLLRIEGSHFLWKMVRRIAGVLVEAGRGRLTEEEVNHFLDTPSPTPARLTAPASGLFLERVFYPGDPRAHPLRPALEVTLGGSA